MNSKQNRYPSPAFLLSVPFTPLLSKSQTQSLLFPLILNKPPLFIFFFLILFSSSCHKHPSPLLSFRFTANQTLLLCCSHLFALSFVFCDWYFCCWFDCVLVLYLFSILLSKFWSFAALFQSSRNYVRIWWWFCIWWWCMFVYVFDGGFVIGPCWWWLCMYMGCMFVDCVDRPGGSTEGGGDELVGTIPTSRSGDDG